MIIFALVKRDVFYIFWKSNLISLLSYNNVLGHLKWKYSCMTVHKHGTMEDVLWRSTKPFPAPSVNYNSQSSLENIY